MTTGVLSMACVEIKGVILAPQVGLEPTTLRLTAERLLAASRCKHDTYACKKSILVVIGGTLGGLSAQPPRACRILRERGRVELAVGFVTEVNGRCETRSTEVVVFPQ